MEVGSIINIAINKKDKICILLSKKNWTDLYDEWYDDGPRIFIFPHQVTQFLGLFECPQQRAPIYMHTSDSMLCYELVDGDRKIWIRDIELKKFGKEI